jgi:hypothetical protein
MPNVLEPVLSARIMAHMIECPVPSRFSVRSDMGQVELSLLLEDSCKI